MNISKFKLVLKFIFGGTEAALDYLLDVFNNIMASDNVARHIEDAVKTGRSVLDFMADYRDWCPTKWLPHYTAVRAAIEATVDTFSDGKVTPDEIKGVKEQFQIAYATWRSDDV